MAGFDASNLRAVGAVLFFGAVAVCWPALDRLALVLDNQHYFFIAERAASGVPPHVSQFDPKHTLSLLISALAIFVGRGLGLDDVASARIVSIAVGAGSLSAVYALTRRWTGDLAAGLAAAAVMASFDRFFLMTAMGVRPKVFLVFFTIFSVYLLERGRPKSAGASAAAAFLSWQPALMMAAFGTVTLLGFRRFRDAAGFFATALAVTVLYQAYFAYHGATATQIEQAYVFPSVYMSGFPHTLRPIVTRLEWIFAVRDGPGLRSIVPLAFAGVAVGAWVAAFVRPRAAWRWATASPARVYFLLAAHGSFAFTLTNYQGYPDRFFIEPFMAVTIGLGVYGLCRIVPERARTVPARGITAIAVALLLVFGWMSYSRFAAGTGLQWQRRLAREVGRMLEAGSSVYAVGCTHLLALNHANNYAKYGFYFRGVPEYLADHVREKEYRPIRNGALPDVVLVSRPKYISKRRWLRRNYTRQTAPVFDRAAVEVWLRKPDAKYLIRDNRGHATVRSPLS